MAKRDYFLIVDTETTLDDKVADFGALVCDRKGKIYTSCAILINGIFTNRELHCLFYDNSVEADSIWARQRLNARYDNYNAMVRDGRRLVASVSAINRWLAKVNGTYSPILTAYNLAFDAGKCANTGIDLDMFDKRFCLWYASFTKWAHTKKYLNFALSIHAFNPPTKLGNMSFKTNAETMARFVLNNPTLIDEPHTALEDARDYELPILLQLLKQSRKREYLEPASFDWRKVQVRDYFTAK
jgi:hypothetical protein